MQVLEPRTRCPLHPMKQDTGTYLPALDGLRGVAILLVLWYHAPFLFRGLPEFSTDHSPWSHLGFFWRISLGGWVGVDLFFVLSGFLITTVLLLAKRSGSSLRVFWGRRALRILPLVLLYLVVLWLNVKFGDPLEVLPGFEGWAWYLGYLGNVHIALYGWQPLAVMILWSLAVEEQFYLVWPLLVWLSDKNVLKRIVWSILLGASVVRAIVALTFDYPATYVLTVCRLDSLVSGAGLALLLFQPELEAKVTSICRRLVPFALLAVLLTMIVPFSPSLPQTRPWLFSVFGYSWLALAFTILVGASIYPEGILKRFLTNPIMIFLGQRCYGLYLWHVLTAGGVIVILRPFDAGYYTHISIWIVGLLIFSILSWALFEKPILQFKRHLPYAKGSRAQVASAQTVFLRMS